MNPNKIMVCGDVHGNWPVLNKLINTKQPSTILACGDFGYWPRDKNPAYSLSNVKPQNTKIHWCDGNHEDHEALQARTTDEVAPGIFYQPRGSVLTLPDGRTVMFFGGADSYDKDSRTVGFDWFREELPSNADVDRAMAYNGKQIDIVISHTCPDVFVLPVDIHMNDPTRTALSMVYEKFKPKMWYFGHWHKFRNGQCGECQWIGLDYGPNANWWMWLL